MDMTQDEDCPPAPVREGATLHDAAGITRINVATYQSVSGAGTST